MLKRSFCFGAWNLIWVLRAEEEGKKLTPNLLPDPGGPGSCIHSPFGPREQWFVSRAGLWGVVLVGGTGTGGLLVAVCQTVRSGPATEQGTVTTAACPPPRLRVERTHTLHRHHHRTCHYCPQSAPARRGPTQESPDWPGTRETLQR